MAGSLNAKIIEVNQLFNKELVAVKKQNVGITKQFYGKITLDESRVYDVVTRFDGYITQLKTNETLSYVKKNEPLFYVYSDKVIAIQNEMKIAQKINKNLYKSALDKLYALDIHSSQLKRIKDSKNIINDVAVVAPFDALVMKKNVNNGSSIKKGKLLMQLANIESLWFIAQVYQKDLGFIKKGMNARIYVDGIKKPVNSTVQYIYPYVDNTNKTVNVRFVIKNPDLTLYPNMFATVKLQENKNIILTLPKTAVLNKGSKYYVFKPVSQSEFEPIEVQVKRISSSKYEILDGIDENEKVINNALFLLDSDAVTNALYEDEDEDW